MRVVLVLPSRSTAPAVPKRRPERRRRPFLVLGALTVVAAVGGFSFGTFLRSDMPGLAGLEERSPAEMTRLLARDGSELASFATEKRILLDYEEIPESFRHALIASEDSRFHDHPGIDAIGVARAVVADIRHRRIVEGASTITMQLAGNLFLDRSQRTWRRKLQESFLALRIEKRFSKEEILRMYTNQVHFGHGLYGLEAAARYYFGKPARALTVGESAMLVGILPRPAGWSPRRDMKKAIERRNLVLRRMAAEGYLPAERAIAISKENAVLAKSGAGADETAPYFKEGIRRRLEESYGRGDLYRGGLEVRTTLDPRLQEIANRAVAAGLAALTERQGSDDVQAALVAIEPASGEILALVGGRDFEESEYDRVTQAQRQPGSLFKPIVYAAALASGWTLADTVLDEPTVFLDPRNPVPYQPENFSRKYYGTITLREALEKSVNIATVKLLDRVGYDAAIGTARDLGFRGRLRPYPSLALGAFELTLLDVTSAYGAFANGGMLFEPHGIRTIADRNGRTIHRAKPRVREAVSPQVAYLMNQALSGVVRRGTGRSAGRELDRTIAGKTGTTDNYTDAWFVGYTPEIAVGVWVGHDDPRSLGDRETGARAALPIWIEFMREALEGTPDIAFPEPPGIDHVPIDAHTGKRWDARLDDGERISEAFVEGTEPAAFCSWVLHRKLMLPYPFQRYALDRDGSLAVPRNELTELLEEERDARLVRWGGAIEVSGPEGTVRFPVTMLPDRVPPVEPEEVWLGTDGRPARVVWMK